MNILRNFNDLFFGRHLSMLDWFIVAFVTSLAKDNIWWMLLIIVHIPISYHLAERFTIRKD